MLTHVEQSGLPEMIGCRTAGISDIHVKYLDF